MNYLPADVCYIYILFTSTMRNLLDFHHILVQMSGVRTNWIKILNSNVDESFFKCSLEQREIHHLSVAVNKYLVFESGTEMHAEALRQHLWDDILINFWDIKTLRNSDNFFVQRVNIIILTKKSSIMTLSVLYILSEIYELPQ